MCPAPPAVTRSRSLLFQATHLPSLVVALTVALQAVGAAGWRAPCIQWDQAVRFGVSPDEASLRARVRGTVLDA